MANFGRLSTKGMVNTRITVITSQGERIALPVNQGGASFSRGGAEVSGIMYTYGTQQIFGSSHDNSAGYGTITAPIAANYENSDFIETIRGDDELTVVFEEVGTNGSASHRFQITSAVLQSPTDDAYETGTDKTIDVVFIGQPT